jgi:YD repeat-containing protein
MKIHAIAPTAALFLAALAAAPASAHAETATYSYDALGRLIRVVYSTGYTLTYSYDANGNRIARVVS